MLYGLEQKLVCRTVVQVGLQYNQTHYYLVMVQDQYQLHQLEQMDKFYKQQDQEHSGLQRVRLEFRQEQLRVFPQQFQQV